MRNTAKITIEADGFKYEKEFTRSRALAIAYQFEKESAGSPAPQEPEKTRGGGDLSEKRASGTVPAKPAAENPEQPKRRGLQKGAKFERNAEWRRVLVCPPADATRNGFDDDDDE